MRNIAAQMWAKSGSGRPCSGLSAFFVGAWPRVLKKALSSALTCEFETVFVFVFASHASREILNPNRHFQRQRGHACGAGTAFEEATKLFKTQEQGTR
jgi:hypothetical protein